jgi:hypothetical protein
MTSDRAQALAKAIKESYRRIEYGSNDIRIKQETDGLIDQLVALLPVPAPQVGNAYVQERNSGFGPIFNRCLGCNETFRSEHGAKFHQCSANAVNQRWLETK